jgi:ParB-like chromosome segregation protein Spo0J
MFAGVALPAVAVRQWRGKTFLIDGWHRVRVAQELGLTHVPALLLPPP